MEKTVYNVIFGGIGGQGVLKASEICAAAAIEAGFHATKSEIHGMSQRGGSVESYVRFGSQVYSPLIPMGKADYLACFHEDEHSRLKPFLSSDGVDLVGHLAEAKGQIDDPRLVNTFILGVLSTYLPMTEQNWTDAIKKVFKESVAKMNIEIFLKGREVRQE